MLHFRLLLDFTQLFFRPERHHVDRVRCLRYFARVHVMCDGGMFMLRPNDITSQRIEHNIGQGFTLFFATLFRAFASD